MTTPVEKNMLNCFDFLKEAISLQDKEMFRSYYEMLNNNAIEYLEEE